MIKAIQNRNSSIAELLIENGAKIDSKTKYDLTPLRLAVLSTDIKSAEMLLRKGASLKIKDRHGNTPMETALDNNHGILNLFKIICYYN